MLHRVSKHVIDAQQLPAPVQRVQAAAAAGGVSPAGGVAGWAPLQRGREMRRGVAPDGGGTRRALPQYAHSAAVARLQRRRPGQVQRRPLPLPAHTRHVVRRGSIHALCDMWCFSVRAVPPGTETHSSTTLSTGLGRVLDGRPSPT